MVDIAKLGVKIETSDSVRELKKGERAVKDFGDTTDREISKARKSFTLARGAILAVTAALIVSAGAAVRGAIRTWIQFSSAVSELSAITGAAGNDLKFLSDAAKEMGRTTSFSANQAAEAFKLVASAKPDLLTNLDALKATTAAALTLAEASGLTLPEAAATLGQALNQFGASAEEATRFINVLAAGAQKGASEINDTAAALLQAGSVARSMAVSFEQANAAVQVLAEQGQKGARAGVALRNVLLILETQTEDKLRPSVVGLSEALRNLASQNLTAAEQLKLFGRENILFGQILSGNVDKLDSLTEALTGTNTAYEQAHTRLDNLNGDLLRFNSAVEAAGIELGETLDPALRSIVQTATDVIAALNDILNPIEFVLGDIGDAFRSMFNLIKLSWIETIEFLPDFMENKIKELLDISADAKAQILREQLEITRSFAERRRPTTPALRIPITGGTEAPADAIANAGGGGAVFGPRPPDTALFIQKIKDVQKLLNDEQKEAAEIIRSNRTAYEEYNETLARATELFEKGLLTNEQFNREVNSAAKTLENANKSLLGNIDETAQIIANSVRGFGNELTDFLTEVTVTGKGSFEDFGKSVLATISRIVIRLLIVEPIIKRVIGALGGAGGGTGGADLAASAASAAGSYFGGFQSGGSFTVGGVGGSDSQLVSFRATPGEKVSIAPPAKANDQQAGGVTVNMNINLQSLDPSNASDVVRSSLRDIENDLIGIIQNASNVRGLPGPLG